jgi:hypothetical protein
VIPTIQKHQTTRDSLRRRIAARKRAHRSYGDLQGRLIAETAKQIRAEIRAERKA